MVVGSDHINYFHTEASNYSLGGPGYYIRNIDKLPDKTAPKMAGLQVGMCLESSGLFWDYWTFKNGCHSHFVSTSKRGML